MQNVRNADLEIRKFCIYLYSIRSGCPWMGGGGIFKRTKLDKGKGGIAKVVSV